MRGGGGRVGRGRREQRLELIIEETHLPPTFANFRQQLGASGAYLLRRALGVEQFVKQLLHALFVVHGVYSAFLTSPTQRCLPLRSRRGPQAAAN
jgi:hypothetical protein